MSPETLRNRIRQDEVDQDDREATTIAVRQIIEGCMSVLECGAGLGLQLRSGRRA